MNTVRISFCLVLAVLGALAVTGCGSRGPEPAPAGAASGKSEAAAQVAPGSGAASAPPSSPPPRRGGAAFGPQGRAGGAQGIRLGFPVLRRGRHPGTDRPVGWKATRA